MAANFRLMHCVTLDNLATDQVVLFKYFFKLKLAANKIENVIQDLL